MSETNLHQDDIKMCQKQFIVNAEKDAQPYQNWEMMSSSFI